MTDRWKEWQKKLHTSILNVIFQVNQIIRRNIPKQSHSKNWILLRYKESLNENNVPEYYILVVKLQSKLNKELTLFSPRHNKNNNNKNPHQNLPEEFVLHTWNLEQRLNSQN